MAGPGSNPLWDTSFQATTFSVLLISAALYGAIAQQVARYAFVYKNDSGTLKLWVYLLSIMTTAGFIVDCITCWGYLTGDPKATANGLISSDGYLLGITIGLVQLFFNVRIWNVRREVRPGSPYTIPLVIWLGLCMLASFGSTMAANTLISGAVPTNFDLTALKITTDLLRFKIVIDAVLDGLVTLSLVTLLQAHRHEFAHLRKESPLTMLMVFFATRGVIVLTCQVVFFILIFAAEPLTVGTANTIIMPKIYAVSMLLTLTNRKPDRGTSGSASSGSRGQRTRASEHVDLVALSYRAPSQPDAEHGIANGGRASPVVFASSKGPPEEVTMEPDPDDWDNSIGDHHRTDSSTKVSLPSETE